MRALPLRYFHLLGWDRGAVSLSIEAAAPCSEKGKEMMDRELEGWLEEVSAKLRELMKEADLGDETGDYSGGEDP